MTGAPASSHSQDASVARPERNSVGDDDESGVHASKRAVADRRKRAEAAALQHRITHSSPPARARAFPARILHSSTFVYLTYLPGFVVDERLKILRLTLATIRRMTTAVDKEEAKKRLSPLQWHVTQEKGTER